MLHHRIGALANKLPYYQARYADYLANPGAPLPPIPAHMRINAANAAANQRDGNGGGNNGGGNGGSNGGANAGANAAAGGIGVLGWLVDC